MDKESEAPATGGKAKSLLFLAVFTDLLGFGIVIPLLPYWAVTKLGASSLTYGLLVASYSAMQFIFAPIWGRVSDRTGRRPVILVGLSGTIIGFGLLALTALYFDSLGMLFASRIISGTFTAATLPTSQAYISDTTTGKDRAKGFGLLGASFGLGFALGPPIGSLLYSLGVSVGGIGFEMPAIFAAILASINLLGAISFLPESLTKTVKQQRAEFKAVQESMRKRGTGVPVFSGMVVSLIVVFSIISLGFSSMESTLILFGQARFNLDASISGELFLIVGGITILTQGLAIRPLSNRFSDGALITSGLAVASLGFLGITTVHTLVELALWVVPLSIGTSIALPTLNSLLSKKAPEGRQGAVLGVNQGMGSLMRVFGPLAATYLLSIDVAYPYYASASLVALALVVTLSIVGQSRNLGVKATLCSNCGARIQQGAAYCGRCGFVQPTGKKT